VIDGRVMFSRLKICGRNIFTIFVTFSVQNNEQEIIYDCPSQQIIKTKRAHFCHFCWFLIGYTLVPKTIISQKISTFFTDNLQNLISNFKLLNKK